MTKEEIAIGIVSNMKNILEIARQNEALANFYEAEHRQGLTDVKWEEHLKEVEQEIKKQIDPELEKEWDKYF